MEIKSLELETVFVNLGLEENVLFDHELLELGEMGECNEKICFRTIMFSPVMILIALLFI